MKENASSNTMPESIESLEQKFNDTVAEIRKLIKGKPDKAQFSTEEKNTLRTKYFQAASIAKKLAERHTDEEKSKKFKSYADSLIEKAQSYGSVAKWNIPNISFDDVKGLENVKAMAKTFIFMLKNPDILKAYHMEGGLGLLLYGAPGTGKTMIAEAIAHEMKMPLFVMTPADIFKSYVGESEQAVREIFNEIETCDEGAILFVDECESIFSTRSKNSQDYKSAVTTELLQRMDGFGVDGSKRILIGATNRPEMIDPAYLRHKRFSHFVHVTPPDAPARYAIIEKKLKGIALADITLAEIAAMTECAAVEHTPNGDQKYITAYYSSADICGIMEEVCRLAMEEIISRGGTQPIPLTRKMFESAFEKFPPSISRKVYEEYNNFRKD